MPSTSTKTPRSDRVERKQSANDTPDRSESTVTRPTRARARRDSAKAGVSRSRSAASVAPTEDAPEGAPRGRPTTRGAKRKKSARGRKRASATGGVLASVGDAIRETASDILTGATTAALYEAAKEVRAETLKKEKRLRPLKVAGKALTGAMAGAFTAVAPALADMTGVSDAGEVLGEKGEEGATSGGLRRAADVGGTDTSAETVRTSERRAREPGKKRRKRGLSNAGPRKTRRRVDRETNATPAKERDTGAEREHGTDDEDKEPRTARTEHDKPKKKAKGAKAKKRKRDKKKSKKSKKKDKKKSKKSKKSKKNRKRANT